MLDKCLKSPDLEDRSTRNLVVGPKYCWNLNTSTFIIFIDHFEGNSFRRSLSKWYAGLLVNTLTADEKYSVLNSDSLTQPIQMQLSKKLKSFSELFCAFFKSTLYFERFLKNDDPHSLSIPESTNCESGGQTNVSKVKFQKILQQATWQLVPKTI